MKRKSRKPRKSKEVFCFIVEGYTEENYINQLKMLCRRKAKFPFKPSGGAASQVLIDAKKALENTKKAIRNEDDYTGYVVWFDADKDLPANDKLKADVIKAAAKKGKHCAIYISEPCIESWLLAHCEEITNKSNSSASYRQKLKKYFPRYEKNDRNEIAKIIDSKEKAIQALENYGNVQALSTAKDGDHVKIIRDYFCPVGC